MSAHPQQHGRRFEGLPTASRCFSRSLSKITPLSTHSKYQLHWDRFDCGVPGSSNLGEASPEHWPKIEAPSTNRPEVGGYIVFTEGNDDDDDVNGDSVEYEDDADDHDHNGDGVETRCDEMRRD